VIDEGSPHAVHEISEGPSHVRRHLYGEYDGCVRDFGAFDFQDVVGKIEGVTITDEGFPVLRAVAGAGQYVGANIVTLRFSRGRYTVVDSATFCGDPWPDSDPKKDPTVAPEGSGDDVTTFGPPFEGCQRDYQPP
jgi:hypothetical protein